MRRARFTLAVVGGSVALMFLSVFAGAQLDSRRDRNDTKGLLDVKRVEVAGRKNPRFKTITYARWGVRRVWDRGYDIVWIDARGDRWFEYYAFVYSDGSRMRGLLYRNRRNRSDFVVSELPAWKPARRSVTVRVPLGKLRMPERRTFLRWYVQTLWTGPRCRRVCIDRAPDRGSIRTALVPTPTPTPSPTPTLSPSPSVSPTGAPSPSVSPTGAPSPSPS